MSSPAPRLPDSGWRIVYKDAFQAFLGDDANLTFGGAVSDWIVACKAAGPPEHSIDVGDGLRLSTPIPGAPVVVEYRIVESEFAIIVKRFMRAE